MLALDLQDVVRVHRSVHQGVTSADVVALVHDDVLALRNEVLAGLATLRRDDDATLALGVLAEGDDAIDLGDDRHFLGLAGLEQLSDPRKTTRDVLGLRGLARNLREDIARLDLVSLVREDVCRDRKEVACLFER